LSHHVLQGLAFRQRLARTGAALQGRRVALGRSRSGGAAMLAVARSREKSKKIVAPFLRESGKTTLD
jgi:hypothetical protein